MPTQGLKIRRALLSVSNKEGLVELAKTLHEFGIEMISTGGTFDLLKKEGIPVKQVSDVTGFPEILDGRVKTLHPKIHGGILGRLDDPNHVRQMKEHDIAPIDLVVVNLYPFEQTIAKPTVSLEDAIEQIDIGGPAMVRASAKNYKHTVVVVDPSQYPALATELREQSGEILEPTRYTFAVKAFEHTARYDATIAAFLAGKLPQSEMPDHISVSLNKTYKLRYGENPHQQAAVYGSFDGYFEKLHGKELSFNNLLDIQAAASLCAEFEEPTVVIVKHNNPCGVASANSIEEAYKLALATDPKSAFGGIVCLNRPVNEKFTSAVNEIFTEVIIAPDFPNSALAMLTGKKDRRLVRQCKPLDADSNFDIRSIAGGLLVQTPDTHKLVMDDLKCVTKRQPTASELQALLFAWNVAKHVKSNAIVYAKSGQTLGIGAGQMSRIDSSRIAALKAQEAGFDLKGCAVASDAFFPFPDGLLEAVRVGATAVIQPGGSVRDAEVIKAADEHNVAMVFTGIRHFRH
jgi:phosphoribosylaminoimidazolecarboxamide formyltransferase/IMP cyclohydrolase